MRSSVVLASLLSVSAPLFVPAITIAQDVNPYGRIDPIDASASVLRQAVGSAGVPGAIAALDDADVPEIQRLLELLLDHPESAMRTTAAVRAAARGADPRRLRDRLRDEDSRGAFVVGLLGDGRLTPESADLLLAGTTESTSPVATAILAARSASPTRLARLTAIADDADAPPLARGIAAAMLETSTPGAIAAWLTTLADLRSEDRDRAVFEVVSTLEPLEARDGIRAILATVEDRPTDDALRAGVVFALLQLDPTSGLRAWSMLAENATPDRAIPNAMLLVSAEVAMPADAARLLPANDDLQKAVRSMVLAAPSERPARSIDAVRLGHLPTIRWLLDLPAASVPPEVLDAMIDAGVTRRRTAMIDVLLQASARLGSADPSRINRRLSATDDDSLREILLRGLIAAGTAEAAEIARPSLSASDRRTRSLALLAVASGSEPDAASVRRLGRAAAGGGDLPDDLRPLAAWHHLVLEGRLNDVLPTLLTP